MTVKRKHLLIDGDPLIYRSCNTKAPATFDDVSNGYWNLIEKILWDLLPFPEMDDYTVFISGTENFRKKLYPDYKANRKGPKPPFFEELREEVLMAHNSVLCEGYEADDGITIEATLRGYKNCVIVSLDKDLRQLPCENLSTYDWKLRKVTPTQAERNFWKQVLTGDSVDNIKGAKGIGPSKAEKLLGNLTKRSDLERVVRQTFRDISPQTGDEDFTKAYTLCRLLRTKKELEQYL